MLEHEFKFHSFDNKRVSHLQYVDNTILFISDDAQKFRSTLDIVSLFEKISGLRINNQNSSLKGIFMGEFEINRVATMAKCAVASFSLHTHAFRLASVLILRFFGPR